MDLLDDHLGCYRNIAAGNFFISISIAKPLLDDNTYLMETLRSNGAQLGNEVRRQTLRRGEVYGR